MESRASNVIRALLAAILVSSVSAGPTRPEEAVRLREWAKGPIRYILSADEEREFRRLDTDNERTAFIERFWARRDPSPRTYENEYRELFWARVRDANEKFRDSAGPGWRTDRGKIYILHGPPNEVQSDEHVRTDTDSGTGEGLVRWLYERPAGRLDLEPVTVVPFVRGPSGEYRLSYDPNLTSVFLDWNFLRDLSRNSPWAKWVESVVPTSGSQMSAMLDLGRMQDVPRSEEILLAQVDTYEIFGSSPLSVTIHRLEPPGATASLVVLTYFLPPSAGESETALVARLTPREAGRAVQLASEAAFRIETVPEGRIAETRFRLEPGTWELLALCVDPDSNTSSAYRTTVSVPPRSDRLHLSDVVLAGRLEPVPYAAMATYDAPFTAGAFRLRARSGDEIRRGEPLQLFLEAYGGAPPYRASFRLEGEESDGRFTALGDPVSAEDPIGAFAWSLPTSPTWPPGRYRVLVRVSDDGGSVAESEVRFALVEAP